MNKLQYFIELKQFRIILQKHIKWMQDWHIFQEFTYTCTTFTGSFDCKIYIFSNIVPNNKVIWKTSIDGCRAGHMQDTYNITILSLLTSCTKRDCKAWKVQTHLGSILQYVRLKFVFLAALASWLCRLHSFWLFLADKLVYKFWAAIF